MHKGHRGRLINKVIDKSSLCEHELLEALLFNVCPRKDMNGTAHALVARFGSLNGVLNASCEELLTVNGVGKNIAEYIVCIKKSLDRCGFLSSFSVIKSSGQFIEFFKLRAPEGESVIEMFMLDKDGRARRACKLRKDTGADEIIKFISLYYPYGLFVGRSAAGNISPTAADDRLVAAIASACRLSGVRFYDYCITSRDSSYSYFVEDRLPAED